MRARRTFAPSAVRFAHAVNSAAKLADSLASPGFNFLEADIILGRIASAGSSPAAGGGAAADPAHRAAASSAQVGTVRVPVMGHDPGSAHDLTLADWLRTATATRHHGIKLDFKEWAAAMEGLELLNSSDLRPTLAQVPSLLFPRALGASESTTAPTSSPRSVAALVLNADVLSGPGGDPCRFHPVEQADDTAREVASAQEFVRRCVATLRSIGVGGVISLGWSSSGRHRVYTEDPVNRMIEVVRPFVEEMRALPPGSAAPIAFTFAVKASFVPSSHAALLRLLDAAGPDATLSVWTNDPLTLREELWLAQNLDPARTLFDLNYPRPAGRPWPMSPEDQTRAAGEIEATAKGLARALPSTTKPLSEQLECAGSAARATGFVAVLAAVGVALWSRWRR